MADNPSGFSTSGAVAVFGPLDGRDKDHEACRSLWVAVIQKAIKDMAYSFQKRGQSTLTPSEREKLHRIYELEAPESFFQSPWFEEICLQLELSPSRIRTAVLDRYEDNGHYPFPTSI
ncbi:MAG: hypothetical protein ACE5HV_05725 [Acidobacteriota bacterium]